MSEQETLQIEKKRRPRKEQEPKAIIDISSIKNTPEGDTLERMAQAVIHDHARREADTRYARRVKVTDQIVQELAESLRNQIEQLKTGERPKMWVIIKNALEALKIIAREVGISAAELAKAIKIVFGPIDAKIDAKSLETLKASVKSALNTCTKHGFEIHPVKIDKVERYFLHRNKEDFDAYRERKEQRIDNEFHSLDEYLVRAERILNEQNAKEKEEPTKVEIGVRGETVIESEQTAEEQTNQANEGSEE